ncbi:MAG: lipopolysaccharide assembly protein LapA domain-containing protein, partial [Rhodocyclaceae bacterium]|nr:lipopolysaccharide assembly protein LapA domain-containing protein [Rhodocyclaceae bacterium]
LQGRQGTARARRPDRRLNSDVMNALLWVLRGILFVILLGLAIKNGGDVELRFFFDARWQAPLSLVLLAALACGVVLGLLALLPQIVRQRRSITQLRRQVANGATPTGSIAMPGKTPG